MKAGIHPAYDEINVKCACWALVQNKVHPQGRHARGNLFQLPPVFYRQTGKLIDTAGRVDKFEKKYKATRSKKAQPQPVA